MPAEHLSFPAAIQVDDMIAVDRSPDRNRRGSFDNGFCCRFPELTECLMHSRDQGSELIGGDLMASEIRADDLRDEFGRLLIWHRLVPFSPPETVYPPRSTLGRRF
jgi:hypothetical protein